MDTIRLIEARLEQTEYDEQGADAGVWRVRGSWGPAGSDGEYEDAAGDDPVATAETAETLLAIYLAEVDGIVVECSHEDPPAEHYGQVTMAMPDGSRWLVRAVRVQRDDRS